MKLLKLSLVAAALLAGNIAATAQNADEIMSKHVAAVGGIDNWNKIKTIKLTGTMNQGGYDISITQTVEVGKALRMDISAGGMTGFQIVTTTQGWMYMPFMGATKIDTMKPEMVKAAQKQLDVKGSQMLDYKANGIKADYEGKDSVSGTACYKIKIVDKEGNESMSYFDCGTYYLLRTESKVKQDDQEQEVSVQYNNYKKLDEGIVLPGSIVAQGAEITFKTMEINKPIDPSTFVPSIDKK